MCVILFKPKNVNLPNKSTIKAMWEHNSDGAGFMWKDVSTNTVHYRKGYFDFEKFYSDVKSICTKDMEFAIHCRIATSGGVNKGMCHPFPLLNNDLRLKSSHGDSDSYPIMMHNGVIPTTYVRDLSDTCSYIINSLVPRYKKDNLFFYNPIMESKIEHEIAWSKLLFFSPKADAKMIGDWKKMDGCYYSNLRFVPYKAPKRSYESHDRTYVDAYGREYTYGYGYSYRQSDSWRESYKDYWNALLED